MATQGKVDRQKIYKQIEERTDIPRHRVEEAVKHQFNRTADLMASGDRETRDFPKIRLQYFGQFYAKEERIKHLQKAAKKSNE